MGSSRRIDRAIQKLESLKSECKHMELEGLRESEGVADSLGHGKPEEEEKPAVDGTESALVEEVVKELREVKRQNIVTHRLLSAMILVTLVWQISEVSIILKVHHGLSHPFKSLGSMISGFLGRRKTANLLESETGDIVDIVSPVLPLNMSDLPRAEWHSPEM